MKPLVAKALVVLLALVMVSTAFFVVGSGSVRASAVAVGAPRVVSGGPAARAPSFDSVLAPALDSAGTPDYWGKMSSSVQSAASAPDGTMDVAIYTTEVAQLGALLRKGGVDTKIGSVPSTSTSLRVVTATVPEKLLEKIAALDGVVAVAPAIVPQVPDRADPDLPAKVNVGDGPAPNIIEAGKGHQVPEAWALGFTGSGVQVAVMDSGIDFGNPDLQGTEARVSNIFSPYYNWPIAFDPNSMAQYLLGGYTFPSSPGSWYVDTSFMSAADPGTGNLFLQFNGITYNVAGIPSASGVYHLGLHPDNTLPYWWGERPAVLVTDSVSPGVYDTVYVDLNDDYVFGNDKPVTVGSPEAWADFYNAGTDTWDFSAWNAGDGVADISGGMVYFIADGANPIPYSDVLANRYGLYNPYPYDGDLVAFMLGDVLAPGGDHGTLCASSIVAQNVTGHVLGFAPDARMIAVGNIYAGGFSYDIYNFVAEGYDGIDSTGDEAQIASASFGYSGVFNDGWDYEARYVEFNTLIYPNTGFSVSTGNGGHGFGTITSPSSSNGVISVGASTSYNKELGVEGFEDANQSTFGDVQPWSNRGPSTLGMPKPDIVTVGAWATGDGALNSFFGAPPWTVWGGTSLSAPATAGIMALIAQAWYGYYGSWYDFGFFGKTFLVDGADNIHYDAQVMGHGLANAYRSVRLASFQDGVLAWDVDTMMYPGNDWAAGGYRGAKYPSFARILAPGDTSATVLEVLNMNGTDAKDVTIGDWELDRIGSETFPVNTTNSLESAPDFLRPDYLYDITDDIPAGTNLVKVTVSVPFSQFDPNGDYVRESSWRLVLYDWEDYNANGIYWNDLNGNGVVNAGEMDNSAGTEVMRFTYGYPTGTNIEALVHDPLDRIHDGLLLGIQHRFVSDAVPFSNLTVTVDFYQAVDATWLSEDTTAATIGSMSAIGVILTVTLPADQPLGTLSAIVTITDTEGQETQFPVLVNVAATGTDFSFGNDPNSKAFLDNNRVFGGFDWTWRAEAGDWRFFFTDIPDSTPINPGDSLLVHTWWENVPTDIDTIVMGPTMDDFSGYYSPSIWGPYTLDTVGESAQTLMTAGTWAFQTATGGAEEWVSAPLTTGLHEIALHNVLYAGLSSSEVFGGEVGTFGLAPNPWVVNTPDDMGNGSFATTASMDLPGLSVLAFGVSQPVDLFANYIEAGVPWTTGFSASDIGVIDLSISDPYGYGMDLDLYLYIWTGSGYGLVASSAGPTAQEHIRLTMPQSGDYLVYVDPFNVPMGFGYFDYGQIVVAGTELTPTDVPTTLIPGGTPSGFNVTWNFDSGTGEGWYYGVLFVGPMGAPAVEVDAYFYLYDNHAPTILATTPADGSQINGKAPRIEVLYEDTPVTSGIQYVAFAVDGMDLGDFGFWNQTTFLWSFPFDWADGFHYAEIYVLDYAGYWTDYFWTFIVDSQAPSLTILSPTATLTNVDTVDVVGFTDVDATVTVNGVPAEVNTTTGDFVATVDLLEGTNLITTMASDLAGNVAVDKRTLVLDTIAPDLAVASPSDGDLVNTNVVEVTGTAEVGAALVVNGFVVTVDSGGDWAIDLAFADGTHTITTTATDAAGNVATDVRSVTVDTTAPVLSVTSPAFSLTNTATVTVEGTTEVGADLTVNGVSVTVQSDGSFSADVTLVAGSNEIEVEATDAAGNVATVTRTVVLDTVAPAVAITLPASGALLNSAAVHVTGTAEAGAQVTVNGVLVVVTGGAWSVDLAFTDGDHTITAVATDAAGNSATVTRTVTVDTVAPTLSVSAPTATLTNHATATVAGVTEPGATLMINGVAATVGSDGSFSGTVTLVAGANTITVRAMDAAGNAASVVKTITLDTTAPVVTVSAPTDGSTTNHSSVVVSGSVDDLTATVLVNGILVQPNAAGAWSVSVALAEGSNTISVSAIDPAGNQGTTVTRQVTYTSPLPGMQNGIDSNANSINGLSGNLMLGLVVVAVVALAAVGAVYFLLNRKIGGGKKPEL